MSEPAHEEQHHVGRRLAVGLMGGGALATAFAAATAVPAQAAPHFKHVANYAELRKFKTNGPMEPVLVLGVSEPDDGGVGFFRWDPEASTDDVDGGTVLASDAGRGVWRRIDSFPDALDPRWFGCRADGDTDDTAAFQAAVAAALRLGRTLLLPRGRIRLTGVVTLPEEGEFRQLVIEGHGQQESELVLAGEGRLEFDLGKVLEFQTGHFVLRDLALRCESADTVTALTVLFDREMGSTAQTALIENVEITGVSDATGPKVGMRLLDACATRVRGARIQGVRSGYGDDSVGILLQGNSIPVEIYISEVNAYFLHTAFKIDGEQGTRLEGIHFDKVAVVAADYGIVARAKDEDQSLWVKVTGSHLNCTRGAIWVHNYLNVMFTENLIYGLPTGGDSVDYCGISITGNAAWYMGHLSIVSNNTVVYMGASTAARVGILVDGSDSEDTVLITGNVIGFMQRGIHLASGASRVAVASTNLFRGDEENVVDEGTDNVVAPDLASWF